MQFAALKDPGGSAAEDIAERAVADGGGDSEEQSREKGQTCIESTRCTGNGEESQCSSVDDQEQLSKWRPCGQSGKKSNEAAGEGDEQIAHIE